MKSEKYEIKNTLGMFDLLKGVAMLGLVIGHTYGINENYDKSVVTLILLMFSTFFGEAAMPALFMVSGYGFRKSSFKKCFTRLYKTILIPFAVTVTITSFVNLVSYYLL